MRLFITGATGLIGRRLVDDRLERGDQVLALSRNKKRASRTLDADAHENLDVVEGDPTAPGDWQTHVDDCDAVVHLAGAGVTDRRWTSAYKDLLVGSRVDSTRHVVEALKTAHDRPGTFVCSSACGYYGATSEAAVDEGAGSGNDFLARLAVQWEEQAQAAESLGVRVVRLRTGVVLDERGGALPKMAAPFRLFMGGPVGSGRQYLPWVHHRDVIGLIDLALREPRVTGPLNVTAPAPVTNREFSATLGAALNRPSWLPVPPLMLRLALGELATYAMMSQRIIPAKAQANGYRFLFPSIRAALEDLVGKP